MTYEFSHNPVKLRLVDIKTGKWKHSYIFVGNVPSLVAKELHRYEKYNKNNSIILKKFYGPDWREKLGLETDSISGGNDVSKGVSNFPILGGKNSISREMMLLKDGISGGNDDLDVLDNLESIETLLETDIPIGVPNDDFADIFDASVMDEIGKDTSLNLTDITSKDIIEESTNIIPDVLEEREETMSVEKVYSISFITDTNVYSVDNILQFKYKIFASIGIPIYRQHLWFKHKDISYPASYSLSINKHVENIDIERLIAFYKEYSKTDTKSNANSTKSSDTTHSTKSDKSTQSNANSTKSSDTTHSSSFSDIEGIPVELDYYKNKDYIHVSAQDTFNLLKTIYNKYSTNEYFLVDLNDLLKPNNLYGKIGKDKYQLEVIYYGFVLLYFPMITNTVFNDYLHNEKTISQVYPELYPSKSELRHKFELESNITEHSYSASDDKKILNKLFSSITGTIVSINNYNQDIETLLSIRNLFDVLALNEEMTYCKANILHDNQNIVLRKSYLNEKEPRDIIPLNSILIKIKTNSDTNENIRIVIFKNGNYVIRTEWREENHMTFDIIVRVVASKVNPIIRMINKLGDQVKFYSIPMIEISKHNANFTETSLTFYYDDDVTETRFGLFKNILDDYRQSGIIIAKDNAVGYEYFFNKGMYKYDASRIEKAISTNNYYDHLSNGIVRQKWETVFEKTRLFQIANASSKLKISISGIRDDIEMDIFFVYLIGLLSVYSTNAEKIKITTDDTINSKSKKILKNLKIQDPLLYDFKKIYKSNVIYSKICQKPYQPLILSDDEYKKLSVDKKNKAVKYWNFTKQKPVWYSCPNMKFPYIKFIVKQHPRDFCIPCCKKIAMGEQVNIKKQEIHQGCLKNHTYTGEKVNLTKGSHYIASYGKSIEVGRLSRLPEHTLEPLFFDTYSPEGTIDQECATADGYYLFGVDQHVNTINSVGYLYCLVHSLNMSINAFLLDCSKRIKNNPDKFRVILDGNAGLYFRSVDDLAENILLLDQDTLLDNRLENLEWNNLFMSIAYYYYGVNTILFDDQLKEMIELILPKGLKTSNEMFPDSHKNLVVLRHKDKYYPIYLFNTEIFKRTGIIDTRLFLNESGLITIIRAVIRKTFENQDSAKIKDNIDLATIKTFTAEVGLKIVHYYINYSNLCYAVALGSGVSKSSVGGGVSSNECDECNIDVSGGVSNNECNIDVSGGVGGVSKSSSKSPDNLIYFPISTSHYSLEKNMKLVFEPYIGNYLASYDVISSILDKFNKWNKVLSKKSGLDGQLIYPLCAVEKWMKVNDSKVTDLIIGFIMLGTNYFIKPISEKQAISISNKPIQILMYHPFTINKLIYNVKSSKVDNTVALLDKTEKSIYDYYLHHLVLLQFISVFNSQRNTSMRRKITLLFSKTNFNKDLDELRKFISEIHDPEDVAKLKQIISRYMTVHHNKKQMLDDINNAYFNFDKIELEKLKTYPVDKIKTELYKLAGKFVKIAIVKEKGFKFPNMFSACDKGSNKVSYCESNKLVIEKKRLDEILDVFAHDIANPAKWKWLFNSIFVNKTVDYFKFIRRKPETITVEFIE
jgi:hypothetical protein